MEEHDLVLNLHGEMQQPLSSDGISLEEAFLPTLKRLHEKFPRLRCVLEASKPHRYADKIILILCSIVPLQRL